MNLTKLSALIDPLSGLLNTGLSLIRDKKKGADTSFIQEKVKNGVSVSSKRMLNLVGTGAMITVALGDMASNAITWQNLTLVAIGAAYSIVMARLSKDS
jgi:hypothetical protein